MVVIFTKDNNTIEIKYEMLNKPLRMRATNAVRRWELLQLEDQTEQMFDTLVTDLQTLLNLDLSPNRVVKLAEDYYDQHDAMSVKMALSHTNKKLHELSLSQFIALQTRLRAQIILMDFEILTKSTIKMEITIYVDSC